MGQDSEYVYDVITSFGAANLEFTTIKYGDAIHLHFKNGVLPSGLESYEMLAQQLFGEAQAVLRVNDIVGFFVFKRPDTKTLSIHLRDQSFAKSILDRKLRPEKNDLLDAVQRWKARAAAENDVGKTYFRRKHIWLLKRMSPLRVATIANPIVPDRIDINEPCEEGA